MMRQSHGSSSGATRSPRRQSSEVESLRLSTDAFGFFKRRGINNLRGGPFFSLRGINIAGESGGSLDAHVGGNNEWAPKRAYFSRSHPNQQWTEQWTASDRALRVSQNQRLSDLLAAEVEKAGVVTAAGYRSVHQKFLYSEAVEREMRKNLPACKNSSVHGGDRLGSVFKLRSSRFGSLLAGSVGTASRHAPCNSHTNPGGNGPQNVVENLRSASGSSNESSKSNIAPRRSSQVRDLTQSHQDMLQQETEEYQDHERRKLMMDSYLADLDRADDDEDGDDDQIVLEECTYQGEDTEALSISSSLCSQDSFVAPLSSRGESLSRDFNTRNGSLSSLQRRDSNDSLDLDDIFDVVDESKIFSSLMSRKAAAVTNAGCVAKQSNKSSLVGRPSSPRVLAAPFTALSTLDRLSAEFNEVNFDPDIASHADAMAKATRDELKLSVQSSDHDHSYTDKCGWLPWPKRKSESSNGDDYISSCSDGSNHTKAGELLESFQPCGDDIAFLQWVAVPNSNRARAA